MSADGDDTSAKRITFQGNYNQTPTFSPRGNLIAFTARDEKNHMDIFTLDVKKGELKRVTQGQGENEDPSFSPNGRLLVFTTTRNGPRQVVVSNLDGTHQSVITAGGEYSAPSWGPFPK
jgi:TolB protein